MLRNALLFLLNYGAIYNMVHLFLKLMQGSPEILKGIPLNPYISRYTPPFDEFEVDHCLLPSGESVVLSAVPGPSLFVVVAGEGNLQPGLAMEDTAAVKEGHVVFVPANSEIKISAGAAGKLQLYRARVNNKFFD